jgi:hypothetical protein
LKAASEVCGQQLLVLRATNESEIEAAFTNIVEQRPGAVIVCADVFFVARREMIVSLAARYAMHRGRVTPAVDLSRGVCEGGRPDGLRVEYQRARAIPTGGRLLFHSFPR